MRRRVPRSHGSGYRNQNRPTQEVPQLGRDELIPWVMILLSIRIPTRSPRLEGESQGLRLRLAVRERVPDGPTGGTHRVRLLRASQEMWRRRGPTEQLRQ